ncbi:type 1 glutamine amidotransferase domain-containing protein [Halodesulfovibrio sp.]|jgi:protease I|uniref:type 1 glutamine amidotransferase domain-containing protein n=1 Tax=Halodesulfovibrio sp. TaxID=1912772 RepID=UPI0025E9AE44|nr:type 1 glutamine amidotransferase domain-containing protein [Halodesulfovibrio sp.]MCT4533793.1 type 1 glutamine amidotransferase [Halodesulfovibrio sp.]
MGLLDGKKVLMFVGDFFEDLELMYPKLRLIEEGAAVVLAGLDTNATYKGYHGYPVKADVLLSDVNPDNFDILVLAGGFAPDKLRRDMDVKKITRKMHEQGKTLAFICHAGWIPISAGIVKGYTCTSTRGIIDDLENAGAKWVNESVVVDRNMVSSRAPDDLPAFCRAIIQHASSQQ